MKSAIFGLLWSLLVCSATSTASGQVFSINQFKTTIYSQTNAAPPVAPDYPDAYFSGTYVITDPDYSVTNMVAYTPNNDEWIFTEDSPSYFSFNGDYYADVTNFDADYPGGTFDYNFDYTDAESNLDNVDIYFDCSTNDLNAAEIPAFTPACWTAMQAVDPAQDFTLSWNNYELTPGADFDHTFLGVSDAVTGVGVFGPNFTSDITSAVIPAGTLQYGRVYNVSLYFSERQAPPTYGFGGSYVNVGWDNLTQTTLSTLPLCLQIIPAGPNVVLMWPADATSYHLETTADISTPDSWNTVTNMPAVMGTTNVVTLPALNTDAFFRLAVAGN